ncbi:hypothetical protein [Virgibacillus sp. SK37]|uniref:hypothetical protein n=1 Tax=Virgibacillus sp. SK37 TaxID=403957 RepID=UPI0004D19581|nr:hypothetical protein [Virgibacillus sp. SK37]AIF45115.1 hypothetical protein X953_01670 [Virgibacillus sp. SK37]
MSDIRNKSATSYANVEYVDAQVLADYYNVELETVVNWIKQRQLSGKEEEGKPGRYLVPKEEFEYLKSKRDKDPTEVEIKKLLGPKYGDDWEPEIDE